MQIVIEIPKEMHKAFVQGSFGAKYNMYDLVGCVMNGTPLPKGHGRLIDADIVTKDINAFQDAFAMYTDNMGKYNIVCTAPTVIEADKDGDTD